MSGFAFETRKPRYFSPPPFISGELTAGWSRESPAWVMSFSGGDGGRNNTAAASAVGAYAYSTLGLSLRRSF